LSLTPGTRLGPYEIVAPIGAGGMGEVYRATDSNLKRSVAIKVLPASVAGDADRLARFQREAEVLAALNHPNIAAIYGLERTADVTALVMELVEGEDLSAHIARGAIPLGESLPIAKQIADALEAAHEQGIIHRDLKPANVKVRADGTVKVLDFGLAKATDPSASSSSNVANSPTMTSPAMTAMGMILGTAAYMSPEQAKGRAVDRRADIWAFGVVLYEMLSGTRAFQGEDVSDLLVAVLSQDVDLGALPAATPPAVVSLIRRCLARDPRKRLRDIGEARLILEDPASFEPVVAPPSPQAIAPAAPLWRRVMPWATTAVFGAGLVVALLLWAPWKSTPLPESRRLLTGVGADAYVVSSDGLQGSAVAVSPDGRTLVFMGAPKIRGSQPRLFVRKLDQLQATALDGTEGAFAPFFSPDSQEIGFFVDASGGALKKIPVGGGAALRICAAINGRGGWWAEDGTIVFSQLASPRTTLMRVSAAGGTPLAFGAFGEGATNQRWPQVLPGGTRVLYTEHSGGNRFEFANLVVVPLSEEGGEAPKVIVRGGSYGRYVTIGSQGYLTFMRQNTLMVMRFDLSRLEALGPAVPVVEDVSMAGAGGSASVVVSPDGTLVYLPNTSDLPTSPIHWLSRDGKTSVLRAAATRWWGLRFSPDGQQLALVELDKQRRIFSIDLARDVPKQVTVESVGEGSPVWAPDSKRLAFGTDSVRGVSNLWLTNADGSGTPTRLTTSPNEQYPYSWDPTGKFLAYTESRPNNARDVMILPVEGDASRGWKAGTPIVFKATATNERTPAFSPDGRWIAYSSQESGTNEIYVSPFPGPGPVVPVSTGGGSGPRWSATSRELLFWDNGTIRSASYTVADTFVPGKPQPWSPQGVLVHPAFDLHPDGKRAAVGLLDPDASEAARFARDKIVFWSGFADYLRKNVVAKK
jgi:serine/threonine-protein kinase